MCIAKPGYELEELKEACRSMPANVQWGSVVSRNARVFGLDTREDVLESVASEVLCPAGFLDCRTYREPGPNLGVDVDAYQFRTASRLGYLAFYRAKTGTWIVKSLHEPRQGMVRDGRITNDLLECEGENE